MFTHVWVAAYSLDHALIKVSRVSQKASSYIVCMSESAECCYRKLGLRSLFEIALGRLDFDMLILNPVVM